MQQNTTRTHVCGPEMTHVLAFLWYFFTVYLGINSNSPSRDSLLLIWHSAHLTELTQKCTHFCLQLQSISIFKLAFTCPSPSLPPNQFLVSVLFARPCAGCCRYSNSCSSAHRCRVGGEGSAQEALWSAERAWAWAAFRCWLSILTSCVASDKRTDL